MEKLIGRQVEIDLLDKYVKSNRSEFVAVYGRRRVGKTFLIKKYFNNNFDFYMSGTIDGDKNQQFQNFFLAMKNAGCEDASFPNNWSDAFFQLQNFLEKRMKKNKRCVIFIDEIPCLDTPKSAFIAALDYFWNTWASNFDNIFLIVCGSATSWIINNIIDNHGGLHNRITHEMYIRQFNLCEVEMYLNEYNFDYDRFMICQLYMAIGGIPYYLSLLDNSKSVAQNIDLLFFGQRAQLKNEFDRLFKSLFKYPEKYMQVIETLASSRNGISRDDIAKLSNLSSGANLTKILKDLENCDFIRKYNTKGKKLRSNQFLYQITDMFTLFYFRFCNKNTSDPNYWTNTINTPKANTWAGLAFEKLCFVHIEQIKKAIGIDKIHTEYYAWYSKDTLVKSQIDMLIERADKMINVCEMKFCEYPYSITKDEDFKLRTRLANFKNQTQTRCGLLLTMITPFALSEGKYNGIVKNIITLNDLFSN